VPKVEVAEDVVVADTEVASPLEAGGAGRTQWRGPQRGQRIGRFTVLETLGRGGMGVVVAAYDPELDRRVAVKIVSAAGEGEQDEYRVRLLREARAMARIRHPNVVSVHEVGEHDGQVYLAMEQVEGPTLRKLMFAREVAQARGWRDILDDFIAAGRGLAAAHAAGMVHRDFKPENVFVDRDGRVLVGDFGLVGQVAAGGGAGPEDVPVHGRLTRADVVMGTPAYMAPEQYTGEPVDARADQFAFCAALYEALYGVLPFSGDGRHGYVKAIARGEIREPPPGRKIPSWLFRVLRRGLSAKPEARFPSMDALLAELGADPKREWRQGRRERAFALTAIAAFLVAWPVAMTGFHIELSYALSHLRNVFIIAIILMVAYFGRRAFARTAFNRKFIGFGLAGGVTVTVLAAGGHAMGVPPDVLRTLHLIVVGGLMATVAVALDARVGVAAAVYLGGYLLAAAWPMTYIPVIVLSHGVAAVNLFIVLTSPRPAA
jgi:hypothetical protein